MRWLFLLLLVLNIFYYLWHQQEAPLRAKEILPFSQFNGPRQDIKLLSESASLGETAQKCLYLGGLDRQEDVHAVEQRLTSLDIQAQLLPIKEGASTTYWLKIAPESRRLVDDGLIRGLVLDFSLLKQKIMSCEGIATAD